MGIVLKSSQALQLWKTASLAQVRGEIPDLSVRQTAILTIIYMEAPPHTVRGLAKRLRVTKPVITRALDTMGSLKLVSRHRDPEDKRNVVITRTVEGALYLDQISDIIIDKAKDLPL